MNSRKAGAILSYVNTLIRVAINFLFIPILIKYIGKDGYGVYNLTLSLVGYFALMDLGLGITIVRFYSKLKALGDADQVQGFLWVIRTTYFGICGLVLLVGSGVYWCLPYIFGGNLTNAEFVLLQKVYVFLLLNTVITLLGAMYESIINGNEKFIVLKSTLLLQLVLQPILAIAIFQFKASAAIYAAIILGLNVLAVSFWMWYTYRKLNVKIKKVALDPQLINEVKQLAFSVFLVLIADQVFFKTNQIILGIVVGASAVAVFAVAATIYMNYMTLSAAINGVFLPKVSAMVANQADCRELSALFLRIGRLQYTVMGVILIGFILYGYEFISLWVGPSFTNAYYMAIIIMLPFTIDLIQNIGNIILQALNRYRFRAYVLLPLSVLNIILSVPLAYYYSGVGCAIATGSAMLIGNGFIMNYYYAKYINIDILNFWRSILSFSKGFIIPFIIGWEIKSFIPVTSLKVLCFEGIVFGLLYFISLWFFSFNTYEKSLFSQVFYKFR